MITLYDTPCRDLPRADLGARSVDGRDAPVRIRRGAGQRRDPHIDLRGDFGAPEGQIVGSVKRDWRKVDTAQIIDQACEFGGPATLLAGENPLQRASLDGVRAGVDVEHQTHHGVGVTDPHVSGELP
jgi:hypothetical protein